MIKKRRPATLGQEQEAIIKMARDESELSRRTGNYKEQSTAGASARTKNYVEPAVDTVLNVTSLGGPVIGAAKMIPVFVKGVLNFLTPRNAAKVLGKGKGKISPDATNAERARLATAQREAAAAAANKPVVPKPAAKKKPDVPKPAAKKKPVVKKPAAKKKPVVKKPDAKKENIYEVDKRTVDPIPPTSSAGRPRSPGGAQTTPKPKPKSVSSKVPTGAKVAAATVAAAPFLVPDRGKINKEVVKKADNKKDDKTYNKKDNKTYDKTDDKTDIKVEKKVDRSSFDSEPDARENPSAWRKWNFKRVKAAEKAGVKPKDIAKSSMDKEISERNTYDVSDKRGGRIKTSPKVNRAVGGMVKPKKKTSSPRGTGCAQRGYGKAMMGGSKVKAYKVGGKVGGNRLY